MASLSLLSGRSDLDPDPSLVSPGILGFAAFFFLAVALYFLVRSMNGRLRRLGYRAAELEAREAEAAEQAETSEASEPDAHSEQSEPAEQSQPAGGSEPREPRPKLR
jgi:hypothetical protein